MCKDICNFVDNKLLEMHSKKIYIAVLEHVKKNKINSKELIKQIIFTNTASKLDADSIIGDLVNAGYLRAPDEKMASGLFITEDGKEYIQSYHRFKMMGIFQKMEHLLKKSMTTIIACIALLISIISLLLQAA